MDITIYSRHQYCTYWPISKVTTGYQELLTYRKAKISASHRLQMDSPAKNAWLATFPRRQS